MSRAQKILTIAPDWNAPLYVQIFEKIRTLILNGELKPGERIPVSRDLQKQLQMSSFTVEKGIRLLVENGWLVRRPRVGTFVPDHLPETPLGLPKAMNNGVVRVLFHTIYPSGDYWFALLLALGNALQEVGFRLELHQISDNKIPPAAILTAQCAGVIYCGTCSTVLARRLSQTRIPLILLGSLDHPRASLPSIEMLVHDDKKRAALGMEHLLKLGHRRILCITAREETQLGEHHRAGIKQALLQQNIPESSCRVVSLSDNPSLALSDDCNIIKEILCQDTSFTAVLTCMQAVSIVKGIRELGLRIPDDISLIALGESIWHKELSLTVVSSNMDDDGGGPLKLTGFAQEAVKRLIAQMKNKNYIGRRVIFYEDCYAVKSRNSTRFYKYGDSVLSDNKLEKE